MACVCGPNSADLLVFMWKSVHLGEEQKQPPIWQGHRQFGLAGACRLLARALAVDLPAMSEAKDQHHQAIVFEFADEPIVTDSVFPEFAQSRAVQRLSHTAWIVQAGNSFVEKLQDALGLRRVEFAQLAVRLSGQLNLPGHDASSRLSGGSSVLRRCGAARECPRRDTDPRDRQGARGWLPGHSRSWCAQCGGPAFQGVFRWTVEAVRPT